tara:strand:- start:54 stop:530 length:477 start_codon:yes stop_codon:yes gene_type:complete
MGTAGMDQLWAGLGALESQKLSGICTIPKLADDVFKENLDFYLENREFDNQKEVVMLNSKGFGGNNATTALLSSNLTESLLSKKYSKTEISKWKGGRDKTLIEREKNMDLAVNNDLQPIYDFDKDVLDLTDLEISKTNIKTTTGFDYKLESDISDDDF